MRMHFGHAAVVLTLLAGTSPAGAQWVQEYETRPVITTQPLPLTQAQRTIIYRTIIPQGRGRGPIVRERVVTEPVAPAPVVRERVITRSLDAYAYGDAYEPPLRRQWVVEPDAYSANAYAVGRRLPATAPLAPLPREIVTEVPAVRSYQYMVVAGRVLLVDPVTGIVVADVTR